MFIEAGKVGGDVIETKLRRIGLCLVAMEMCIVDARWGDFTFKEELTAEQMLNDDTIVGCTTWSKLRKEACGRDFCNTRWFVSA